METLIQEKYEVLFEIELEKAYLKKAINYAPLSHELLTNGEGWHHK